MHLISKFLLGFSMQSSSVETRLTSCWSHLFNSSVRVANKMKQDDCNNHCPIDLLIISLLFTKYVTHHFTNSQEA